MNYTEVLQDALRLGNCGGVEPGGGIELSDNDNVETARDGGGSNNTSNASRRGGGLRLKDPCGCRCM